jgi:hypothetical protein
MTHLNALFSPRDDEAYFRRDAAGANEFL